MHGELKNASHIDVDFVNGEFTFASRAHGAPVVVGGPIGELEA